jgi:hypothetical protein
MRAPSLPRGTSSARSSGMKNHRNVGTDEQIEHHSLPGINMAGKKAGVKECEASEQDENSEPQATQSSEEQSQKPKAPRD